MGASSRLRSLQYIPFLENKGWEIKVSYLFSTSYLDALYNNKPRLWHSIKAYINRIKSLYNLGRFDIVWIEKELFPFFPAIVEKYIKFKGIPYIVDYDDAIHHRYDRNNCFLIRNFEAIETFSSDV